MEYWLAQDTVKRYVCSRCWGPLIAQKTDDWHEAEVVCANSTGGLCNGKGFVTKRYAERRRQESLAEYLEVIQNYPFLLQTKARVNVEKEILSELGF